MSNKTKVLIVTQEMKPYLSISSIASIARQLPQHLQQKGMEIRVLMPRFGVINERRHRLHEVVRLSGINIIIDEDDFPLIIKVASLPGARLQVYFLDNEDFFKRKYVVRDNKGKFYNDNTERSIFFCKGVLETVKKFGWAPDIIHCHGWMTSLIPLFVKKGYADDAIFDNANIVYSVYGDDFDESLARFESKATIRKVNAEDLAPYAGYTKNDLDRGAIHYADAVIYGDEVLTPPTTELLANSDKPILAHQSETEFLNAYRAFYTSLLQKQEA